MTQNNAPRPSIRSSSKGNMTLVGKVAIISGGARGMGAAAARLFAREGANVGVGDVLEKERRQVEAGIKRREALGAEDN